MTAFPCRVAPTIDGKIDPAEWKDAPLIEFDMSVLHFKTQKLTTRTCQWRAMNSANGLYVALQVPDATLNQSLSPLDFDLATLSFCRGEKLAAGDDRKSVAPGIYRDKHFTMPGKEADDKQADGKAAMRHDKASGIYSIEWAIPLDSKDPEDIATKPGSTLRFNLAYIDSFTLELKETQIGSAYAGGLDQAAEWGTLQLSADVKDDGGAAFQGPTWVRKYFDSLATGAVKRMRIVEAQLIPGLGQPVAKLQIEYAYRNPLGQVVTGKAKIYCPTQDDQIPSGLPLFYSAGYELDDGNAVLQASRGFAVATPQALEANPLVRTINPDAALLHLVRALPFIDDSKVIIGGGSAGGYATLLLAAETFPISGAVPSVPPINWGYNAAYFLQREQDESRKDPKTPATPVFDVIIPIVRQGIGLYGGQTSDETYFRHSPLAHLNTITCPVSVYWTTADMLVPIDQVGKTYVRPVDAAQFPPGFTFDPSKLTTTPIGRSTLIELLPETEYEVFVFDESFVKDQIVKTATTKQPAELPISLTKRWSITILDEGAPEPKVGHLKHPIPWSQQAFVQKMVATELAPGQLTLPKLERLLDRYAGREWLPTKLKHLDDPTLEQADVIRGLRTFVKSGVRQKQQFKQLYAKVAKDRRVLPDSLVQELGK